MMETASTNAEKFEWLQHWVAGENVQHLHTQVLTNGQTQKGKNGKLWKTLELWNFEPLLLSKGKLQLDKTKQFTKFMRQSLFLEML